MCMLQFLMAFLISNDSHVIEQLLSHTGMYITYKYQLCMSDVSVIEQLLSYTGIHININYVWVMYTGKLCHSG